MRDLHNNSDSPTTVLHIGKPPFIDDFAHSLQSPQQITLDPYLPPHNSRTAAQSHLFLDDLAGTSKQHQLISSNNNLGSGSSTQYSSNNLSTLNRSEIYQRVQQELRPQTSVLDRYQRNAPQYQQQAKNERDGSFNHRRTSTANNLGSQYLNTEIDVSSHVPDSSF